MMIDENGIEFEMNNDTYEDEYYYFFKNEKRMYETFPTNYFFKIIETKNEDMINVLGFIRLENLEESDHISGIYILVDESKENNVDYIGQSTNIFQRISMNHPHFCDKKHKIFIRPFLPIYLDFFETLLINKLDPNLNGVKRNFSYGYDLFFVVGQTKYSIKGIEVKI